ncbi:MAG: helicase RepA family protein [Alphaproteobacteria bacterium]|nr:helicase RepA family protein [Alphaproteobacteria bacterium]
MSDNERVLDPDAVFELGDVLEPMALPKRPPERAGRAFGALRVLSVADAVAVPQRAYLIKGLIECGALSVVYGEPGCGKSFLAQYFGWHVARGTGAFGRRVRPGGVLYLALEGEGGFPARVTGFAREYGGTEAFHFAAQQVNFFSDLGALEDVRAAALAVKAKLIVVDTLARAIAEGDENTAGDMGALIAVLDGLREATGCHVMLIHHTGKDEARGMRGHSSLNGAADMTLYVSRDAESAERRAEIKKNKDGPCGAVLGFALRPLVLGVDDDGDEVTTMVVEEVTGLTKKKSRGLKLAADQQMWLEEIQSFIAEMSPDLVAPKPDMKRERAVTRHDLMEHFRAKELLGVTDSVTGDLNVRRRRQDASRAKMQRILNALKARKKLAFTPRLVWLLH